MTNCSVPGCTSPVYRLEPVFKISLCKEHDDERIVGLMEHSIVSDLKELKELKGDVYANRFIQSLIR